MVIFQPAMLVYQRVDPTYKGPHVTPCLPPLCCRTWTPLRQRNPHGNRRLGNPQRWVTRRRMFQGHGGQQWRGHSGNELLKPRAVQSGGSFKDPENLPGIPVPSYRYWKSLGWGHKICRVFGIYMNMAQMVSPYPRFFSPGNMLYLQSSP